MKLTIYSAGGTNVIIEGATQGNLDMVEAALVRYRKPRLLSRILRNRRDSVVRLNNPSSTTILPLEHISAVCLTEE